MRLAALMQLTLCREDEEHAATPEQIYLCEHHCLDAKHAAL